MACSSAFEYIEAAIYGDARRHWPNRTMPLARAMTTDDDDEGTALAPHMLMDDGT